LYDKSGLKKRKSIENKNIHNLLNDINTIKKLIKKEKKLILPYESKTNKNNWHKRKNSESLKLSNISTIYKKYNTSIKRLKIEEKKLTSKNLKFVSPLKNKLSFISYNKNNYNDNLNRKNSLFNLITEVNNNNKKHYLKKMTYSYKKRSKTKTRKIPDSEKINKYIKPYMEKNKIRFNNEIKEDSNIDILKKIGEVKNKIKKKNILNIHKNYFSFSKKHQNKIKLIEQLDKKIYNLDKDLIQRTVIKTFED